MSDNGEDVGKISKGTLAELVATSFSLPIVPLCIAYQGNVVEGFNDLASFMISLYGGPSAPSTAVQSPYNELGTAAMLCIAAKLFLDLYRVDKTGMMTVQEGLHKLYRKLKRV